MREKSKLPITMGAEIEIDQLVNENRAGAGSQSVPQCFVVRRISRRRQQPEQKVPEAEG